MTGDAGISANDPLAIELRSAIHDGDVAALGRLLDTNPGLANAWIGKRGGGPQTPTLIAVDWPGHFPNVARTIAALAAAGADVNVHYPPHPKDPNCRETPLHQAASSNDVAAIDALVEAGADVNAPGAIFTGGGPLSDAVIFANWDAAHRLSGHGAQIEWWQAAALGNLDIMLTRWDEQAPPTRDEITRAFWHACRAAQRTTAEYLLDQGADPYWLGWDDKTPNRCAEESGDAEFLAWLRGRLDRNA
jgi:ankyrin repeat protein